MPHPQLGEPAPDFSLCNQRGETVTLTAYRGKTVVLYFYPKALTPGCTTQACGIRDRAEEFAQLNAVVFGVSPDPEEKLQKFIEKHQLNFDLLADPDHAVAEQYGVWGKKKFMGKEFLGIIRTTFIIGPEGQLQEVMNDFKTKTHHEDLLERLRSHAKV